MIYPDYDHVITKIQINGHEMNNNTFKITGFVILFYFQFLAEKRVTL